VNTVMNLRVPQKAELEGMKKLVSISSGKNSCVTQSYASIRGYQELCRSVIVIATRNE
jgi:hypothetical protein